MSTRVLLVEGPDDQHVLWALFQAHRVPETFEVKKADGDSPLLEAIPVWLKASDLDRLGIVLDADEDIRARWEQVRGRLLASGYPDVPQNPDPNGTVLRAPDRPRVGVWLMPDNRLPGMLESFLAFLVPAEDRLLLLVDGFLSGIPAADRRFPEGRLPKARIHAWLTVQEQPGKPLGQAITARYLNAQHEVVGPFLNWVKTVFVDAD
jgi:hypothetical protein